METTDIYLAAALISLGAGLQDVNRSDFRNMRFVLSFSSPIADEREWFDTQTTAWRGRQLLVNARDFADALKELKSEIHR